MSQETRIIQMVAENLERAGIPYMITGSIAINFYALPRMTRDVDIVVEIKNEDIQKIVDLFGKDFYVEIESVREAVRLSSMFNIIENESLVKIDFIIRKNEPYRKVEFERRRQMNISGEKKRRGQVWSQQDLTPSLGKTAGRCQKYSCFWK